jgi:small basic protein (TIGR04137 family)
MMQMSIHRSLVSKTVLTRDRNVLTRAERVRKLADEGKWEEGDSVFALPKVRVRKVKAGGKHKKAAKAGPEEEAAAEPEAGENDQKD